MGPETPPSDRTNFQSLIGCLDNLALSSRPGICFATNIPGSFVETPGVIGKQSNVFWDT